MTTGRVRRVAGPLVEAVDLPGLAMAEIVGEFADNGWINILGGCCGTRPEFVTALIEEIRP